MKNQVNHIFIGCFSIKRRLLYLVVAYLVLTAHVVAAQMPVVKEVGSKNGNSGQQIDIKGFNFSTTADVYFGAAKGTVISRSEQLIEVEIPATATYDNIHVLNTGSKLSGSSSLPFLLSFGGESDLTTADFAAQFDHSAESGLYDLVIADLDGDGLNDVVASSTKSYNGTLLQNISTVGALNFNTKTLSLGIYTLHVTVGDLNGDGKPEIVFTEAGNSGRIVILTNNSTPGTFSFSTQKITLSGTDTKRVAIKDVDLDGKPELIITNQKNNDSNNVIILKNISSGGTVSFAPTPITLTVPGVVNTAGLLVNDLNNDGRPEIIVTQFTQDPGNIYIAQNISTTGNIQFNSFSQIDVSGAPLDLQIIDLNNDNKPDIAATRFIGSSVVLLLNESTDGGTIKFGTPTSVGTDAEPWGLDFGDMDGDGKPDLLVASTKSPLTINILQNQSTSGNLSFKKLDIPVTYINRHIKSGDMDGDGKPDIIFTSIDDVNNGIDASFISILRNEQCIIPKITAEGPVEICTGNTVKISTQLVQNATYQWYRDGTLMSTETNHFIEAATSGNYYVAIDESGPCPLKASDGITVTVSPPSSTISVTIDPVPPVCIGGDLTLWASSGATKYEWRGPEGFTASGNPTTVSDFSFSKTGRYYVDVYSGSCIIETKSIVVEAKDAPHFFITASDSGPFCKGEALTLSLTPISSSYTYKWFDSNNNVIGGQTTSTFKPVNSGSYYAQIVYDPTCPPMTTEKIEVTFVAAPQAKFDVLSTVCTGQTVSFTNQSVVAGDATAEYLWKFGDGNTSTESDPTYTYSTAETYAVELIVNYKELSCQDQISKNVTVIPGIDVEILADSEVICEGENALLSLSKTYNNYSWSTGETTKEILVDTGGTYDITVTDINGCEGSDNITLQVLPLPKVTLTASKMSVSPGEEVLLEASGLSDYSWSPAALVDNADNASALAILLETTTFTVSGTDENGCAGSATIEILVQKDLISNIIKPKNFFSPNDGDDINSMWLIEKIEQFPQCGVTIVDQTGNVVYEAKPYLNDWDGTVQGGKLPSGVYYFVIRCDNEEIVKTGSITLLR